MFNRIAQVKSARYYVHLTNGDTITFEADDYKIDERETVNCMVFTKKDEVLQAVIPYSNIVYVLIKNKVGD